MGVHTVLYYFCAKIQNEVKTSKRWKYLGMLTGLYLCACMPESLSAADGKSYCFRVYLKDKGVKAPGRTDARLYLSAESVERRTKRGVELSVSDIPVSPGYIRTVGAAGGQIITQSKWMNTVVIEHTDSLIADRLKALPIVDSVRCVWHGRNRLQQVDCPDDTGVFESYDTVSQAYYGHATTQIEILNGVRLHEAGRQGKGMRIAVIDAGFLHVDKIAAFTSTDIIGTRNMSFPGNSVFCEDDHGTKVLSCMAANLPGVMVGTAPDASYLLIKSEDTRGEYPIEEDFYAAALEYADSVGVDLITCSLGYFQFDTEPVYTRADLNGRTAFITRVAEEAARKGMLIICSAGNEGKNEWQKITFPADAPNILTVGAVTTEKTKSAFSSTGLTADYRVKPDVVALGTNVCVINAAGRLQWVDGTSFSTPTLAGLCACLWQSLSWLKNKELIDLIRQTASRSKHPDAELGYGVPDMYKAYRKEMNELL